MRAKRDFVKGVYQLIYTGNDENGVNHFDLVFTHSLTGNAKGSDGMNCDFVYEQNITFTQLKDAIRKHKIRRAIWCSKDDYVMPKDILSGRMAGIFFMEGDF